MSTNSYLCAMLLESDNNVTLWRIAKQNNWRMGPIGRGTHDFNVLYAVTSLCNTLDIPPQEASTLSKIIKRNERLWLLSGTLLRRQSFAHALFAFNDLDSLRSAEPVSFWRNRINQSGFMLHELHVPSEETKNEGLQSIFKPHAATWVNSYNSPFDVP